ncbi:MAG: anaerobic sulfatase maturase [Oscillospiraceae bacterium]
MNSVSILIKPASSLCNIECKYCFYHTIAESREQMSFGIMSHDCLETLVKEAINYADRFVSFAFQGGEPTLAGIDFFRKAVELQKKYNTKRLVIENTIQTNGTLINEEWAQFFKENHFLVGLSLDGPRHIHNYCRIDRSGNGTFDMLNETVKLFDKYGVEYNIVSVVTSMTAEKISGIYNYFRQKKFRYMQFIPCLDANVSEPSEYSLTPKAYGKFLCTLFDLWYKDFMTGNDVDIRMFSNYAHIAAGYAPEECGMCGKCTTYFVVEGNGNVYPCDFYATDEWMLGTINDGFETLYESEKSQRFMKMSLEKPHECLECKYYSLCRGGCRRWRDTYPDGHLGVNHLCEAYKIFFKHCQPRIENLGSLITKKMQAII